MALATYQRHRGKPAYGEGSTLQLEGEIELKGHTPVQLKDLFAPTDQPVPAGFFVAIAACRARSREFTRTHTKCPQIDGIHLRVTALAERRWATIDNAWIEKNEVHPGETVAVKVLLRPYRGAVIHSGNSDHDSGADGARHAATGGQRRRHLNRNVDIPGGHLAGPAARPRRIDQADQSRTQQRPPVRNPSATHSYPARGRQG